MKRRALSSIAESLCGYLGSRNNDIAGYWGIGVLCSLAQKEARATCTFKIVPGEVMFINGYEITDSRRVTDKLVKIKLDLIEGRLSFFEDGLYPNGAQKYACGIAVAVTQGDRTGVATSQVQCWPHDASRDKPRGGAAVAQVSLLERLNSLPK
jgi:hypothetical protein